MKDRSKFHSIATQTPSSAYLVCNRCTVSTVFKKQFDDVDVSISFDLGFTQLGSVMQGGLTLL